jgi:urea transport system permease protein
MLETLFFGLSLGSILVLTSIGLAVTFGVMGVINMAHGEMVMLGAYTVWGMQQLLPGQPGAALLLSVPAAFLVSASIGALLERGIIRHLYGRPLETLLATFGVSLILQQAVRTLISPMNRAVESPAFMSGMLRITRNFSLTSNRIYILCFCLCVFALIYLIMHKTRLGLEVRAVTQNRPIARTMGVNAPAVDAFTFALGSGVAGMAGVALSQLTNVGPNLGQGYIVDSFMVVVFGGVGNLRGTLCGGLILGLANKLLEPASGAMLAKIILLAGVILFMQAKPKGLFPERGRAAES